MNSFALQNGNPEKISMYIDGDWQGDDCDFTPVVNPATEDIIAHVPDGTSAHADRAIESAWVAQQHWARRPASERAVLVEKLAHAVMKNQKKYAEIVTLEQGKPLQQAHGEIEAVARFLLYAVSQARRIEGDIIVSDNACEEVQIRRHPYGVVVALTAWNYPAALAGRKLGPALVTGNTVVLLSHEITPLSALYLASLAHQCGFPKGVFNVVTGRGPVIGEALVKHPKTNMVTMTGSTRAGKEIFRTAADSLKVLRLELGGKAPFIVMDDANIDKAVTHAVNARYTNCGQICVCNERMFLHHKIADEFLDKFIEKSKNLTIGNPLNNPDLGPKVSGVEVNKVRDILAQGVQGGAEILLEEKPLTGKEYEKGFWMAPTVLEVKSNDNPLMQQEIFGPVAPALRVDDFEQAITYANDTSYGLSAYVYTQDHRRMMEIPYQLKFGEIYFNNASGEQLQGFHTGWGESGLGGEDGKYGFDGYLRKQSYYVNWE